jgi:hypothetical protein
MRREIDEVEPEEEAAGFLQRSRVPLEIEFGRLRRKKGHSRTPIVCTEAVFVFGVMVLTRTGSLGTERVKLPALSLHLVTQLQIETRSIASDLLRYQLGL